MTLRRRERVSGEQPADQRQLRLILKLLMLGQQL